MLRELSDKKTPNKLFELNDFEQKAKGVDDIATTNREYTQSPLAFC